MASNEEIVIKTNDNLQVFDLSKAKKISSSKKEVAKNSPFLDARLKQKDIVSKVKTTSLLFSMLSIVSLFIALIAVGGLIATAGKSKFVPYIIAVDDHGMAVVSGIAQPIDKVDEKLTIAFLSEFITSLRTVSVDAQFLRRNIFKVYSHLNAQDPAIKKIDEFFTTGDGKGSPFERATSEIVSVKVLSVLQQTPTTYQVDWVETVRDRTGVKIAEKPMRALLTYYRGEIKEELDDVVLNPLGLYISDINITNLQPQQSTHSTDNK